MGERTIKADEVSRHTKKTDLWIILHGKVYDLTNYVEDHPGGVPFLLEFAGKDATEAYEDIGHSEDAREILENHLIGKLPGSAAEGEEEQPAKTKVVRTANTSHVTAPSEHEHAHTYRMMGAVGGGLVVTSSAIFALARLLSKTHLLHHGGGFWKGFGVSAVASISLVYLALRYAQQIFTPAHKDIFSYPAYVKPKLNVVNKMEINVGVLNPREYISFPLLAKLKLSPNVYRFVFSLQKANSIIGLPIGQHVAIRHEVDGKQISRSYTPTSNNRDRGRLELVIKVYPDGAITPWLESLKIGDSVDFRGPKGAMKYNKTLCKEIGMIAGGTGITPCYSIIRAICEDPLDNTKISLIYANNSQSDILLKEQLDGFAMTCPKKFKVQYVLSKPQPGWTGATGYANKDMLKNLLPGPSKDNKMFLCGPPGMINAMKKALEELGFEKPGMVSKATDQVFLF